MSKIVNDLELEINKRAEEILALRAAVNVLKEEPEAIIFDTNLSKELEPVSETEPTYAPPRAKPVSKSYEQSKDAESRHDRLDNKHEGCIPEPKPDVVDEVWNGPIDKSAPSHIEFKETCKEMFKNGFGTAMSFSKADLTDAIGNVPRVTTYGNVLRELVAEGVLVKQGEKRLTRYQVIELESDYIKNLEDKQITAVVDQLPHLESDLKPNYKGVAKIILTDFQRAKEDGLSNSDVCEIYKDNETMLDNLNNAIGFLVREEYLIASEFREEGRGATGRSAKVYRENKKEWNE